MIIQGGAVHKVGSDADASCLSGTVWAVDIARESYDAEEATHTVYWETPAVCYGLRRLQMVRTVYAVVWVFWSVFQLALLRQQTAMEPFCLVFRVFLFCFC